MWSTSGLNWYDIDPIVAKMSNSVKIVQDICFGLKTSQFLSKKSYKFELEKCNKIAQSTPKKSQNWYTKMFDIDIENTTLNPYVASNIRITR